MNRNSSCFLIDFYAPYNSVCCLSVNAFSVFHVCIMELEAGDESGTFPNVMDVNLCSFLRSNLIVRNFVFFIRCILGFTFEKYARKL